jgi:hypothetical protein
MASKLQLLPIVPRETCKRVPGLRGLVNFQSLLKGIHVKTIILIGILGVAFISGQALAISFPNKLNCRGKTKSGKNIKIKKGKKPTIQNPSSTVETLDVDVETAKGPSHYTLMGVDDVAYHPGVVVLEGVTNDGHRFQFYEETVDHQGSILIEDTDVVGSDLVCIEEF